MSNISTKSSAKGSDSQLAKRMNRIHIIKAPILFSFKVFNKISIISKNKVHEAPPYFNPFSVKKGYE